MTTPNTGELLVQQAQEAERLRLLILADECKTIEEFREKLRERLNKYSAGGQSSHDIPRRLTIRHGRRVRRRPATGKA